MSQYQPVPGLVDLLAEGRQEKNYRYIPYRLAASQAATATTSQINAAFITNGSNPFIWTGLFAWQSGEAWTFRLSDQGQGISFAGAQTPVTNAYDNGFVSNDAPYVFGPGGVVGLEYTMTTGSSATLYVELKGLLCLERRDGFGG